MTKKWLTPLAPGKKSHFLPDKKKPAQSGFVPVFGFRRLDWNSSALTGIDAVYLKLSSCLIISISLSI